MVKKTMERADHILRDVFHRCSMEWYNNRLNELEEEIVNVMAIKGWQSWELLHGFRSLGYFTFRTSKCRCVPLLPSTEVIHIPEFPMNPTTSPAFTL